jgi:hypothetical protein
LPTIDRAFFMADPQAALAAQVSAALIAELSSA